MPNPGKPRVDHCSTAKAGSRAVRQWLARERFDVAHQRAEDAGFGLLAGLLARLCEVHGDEDAPLRTVGAASGARRGTFEVAPVHVERGESAWVGRGERQHAEPETAREDRAGGGDDRRDRDLEARRVVRQEL